MKILVTGATGFIGRPLTLRLLREHDVIAWTRDAEAARSALGAEVEICSARDGDDALERAVRRVDVVVNLAGASVAQRWTRRRRRAIVDSRVELTARLVRIIERCERPPALISASAVGNYGHDQPTAKPLAEDAPGGDGFLADVCRAWEIEARRAELCGARVARLRIGVVLGRGGGALAKMLPPFRLGLGGPLGSGRQAVPWIHIDDVVEIIARAVVDERYRGAINVCAPRPLQNSELAQAIARAIGRRSWLRVPAWVLELMLGSASAVVLGGQAAVPRALESLGYVFRFPDIDQALADIVAASRRANVSAVEIRPLDRGEAPQNDYLAQRPPRYLLSQTTIIDAPIDEVFDFFSNAENLGAITPPDLGFVITTATPIEMREGATIDYRIKLGPLPLSWRTRIDSWQPGRSFSDAQERGPYRCWWHEHRFRDLGGGKTLMEDRVYYALPFGPLGRLVHRLAVAQKLREIFGYRASVIAHRFGPVAARPRQAARSAA